jgi:hypothetical protein
VAVSEDVFVVEEVEDLVRPVYQMIKAIRDITLLLPRTKLSKALIMMPVSRG